MTRTPDPADALPRNVRVARAAAPGEPSSVRPMTEEGGTVYRLEGLPQRIAEMIIVNPVSGCWEWQGDRHPRKDYGKTSWEGRRIATHRVVYKLLVGPLPDDLTLDHVKARGCISNACCWPAHLEPVTGAENNRRGNSPSAVNARKTQCIRGHQFNEENTSISSRGHRICKICQRLRSKREYIRIKLPFDVSAAAREMSRDDGMTLNTWLAELIRVEAARRTVDSKRDAA